MSDEARGLGSSGSAEPNAGAPAVVRGTMAMPREEAGVEGGVTGATAEAAWETAGVPRVAVVMGSQSDWPTMQAACETLERLGVGCQARILSAHRTPRRTAEFAAGAAGRGLRVIIAEAGGAAHLAGAIAAQTTLPVIGVPLAATPLAGLDALLATVQMPAGIPVATVAIGRAGAKNAAVLAAEILALKYPELKEKLLNFRKSGAKF